MYHQAPLLKDRCAFSQICLYSYISSVVKQRYFFLLLKQNKWEKCFVCGGFASCSKGFPSGSDGKKSACNAGDQGSILQLGRPPGEWNGNPLEYSCLLNPMAGYSPSGPKESDTTEHESEHFHFQVTNVKVSNKMFDRCWPTGYPQYQQWPQDRKRSVFIPIPKKGNVKGCSNYCTVALTSHISKLVLKILQVRLQQYMNH